MKCIQCKDDAHAICKFCGRAICETHMKTQRYATGFGRIRKDELFMFGTEVGITIENATWCGKCIVEYRKTY